MNENDSGMNGQKETEIENSKLINIDSEDNSKQSIDVEDISKQSIDVGQSSLINNANEINISDIDIDSRLKSSHRKNYITRTVLYSYDLDGHLVNYKLTDSRIISWCEVKSNASSTSKLVVAFSNKTLCAYSLPCLDLISTITLDNVPIIIHYNEERNKLVIIQEGN